MGFVRPGILPHPHPAHPLGEGGVRYGGEPRRQKISVSMVSGYPPSHFPVISFFSALRRSSTSPLFSTSARYDNRSTDGAFRNSFSNRSILGCHCTRSRVLFGSNTPS